MSIDILIFAAVAVFLIYRLNNVLGTRNGAERERKNPFQDKPEAPLRPSVAAPVAALPRAVAPLAGLDQVVKPEEDADGKIAEGLGDIVSADPHFEVHNFIAGAKYAFEAVVTAYARGDTAALRPLLSPKLFKDFSAGISAREAQGHKTELTLHRIKQARITAAHLGGTMAYITVDFDVEETHVTRDAAGNIVDGNPDRVFSVEDIWSFTRDTRSHDPNWIIIETRAADQADILA